MLNETLPFSSRATISPSKERNGRDVFAGVGNIRELICKELSSPRPERYPCRIPAGKTAVAVELDPIEPFLAFRQLIDQSHIHRLDEPKFGGRQHLKSLDPRRNGVSDAFSVSLDHPVCPRQHVGRNRQADLLGSYQVNHELKLRGLLDWQLGGLGAFENFVYVGGRAPNKSEKFTP